MLDVPFDGNLQAYQRAVQQDWTDDHRAVTTTRFTTKRQPCFWSGYGHMR